MSGFEFRYRLCGGHPTVGEFPVVAALSRGDILSWTDDGVQLAAAGNGSLIGAAQDQRDDGASILIRAVTDADAVYAVHDPYERTKGDRLALGQGAAGVLAGPDDRGELVVVLDSNAASPTLVRIHPDSHHLVELRTAEALTGGELNAAIARSVVRFHNEHLGRGPTRARAFYRDNLVIVLLEDAMTKAEQSLAAVGNFDAVRELRRAFQTALRPDLIATVETLTGCKVKAFMSATHLDPDMAGEIFVLDRPVAGPALPEGG